MLKKTFTIKKIVIFIFVVVVFFLIFTEFNNIKKSLGELKQTNKVLMQENDKFRLFSLELCQNTNDLSDYFFINQDCSLLFGNGLSYENETNFEAILLNVLDLFVIEKEKNKVLVEEIYTIAEDKKAINKEEYLESSVLAEGLLEILNNNEIKKYFFDHNIVVATSSNSIIEIKKEEEVLVRVLKEKWKDNLSLEIVADKKMLVFNSFESLLKIAKEKVTDEQIFDIEAFKKEAEGAGESQENQNILILGRSGENIDTIMMASLNRKNKQITLISIPRDLFYESRKINSYYHYFGIKTFIEKISAITGQNISNYLMIDMMVFPEVVDALGGIDFEFETPLIDPYYKTIDNGKEGTLYYPKGLVHLNGIEALRVARSRYTTSDFSRAARQQKLVKSVSARLKDLKTGDILFKYIPMSLERVETDLNIYKITSLFLNIRDFDIRIGSVVSSGNILDSKMYDLQDGKKMFILEPKEGDWRLIEQYIIREINK